MKKLIFIILIATLFMGCVCPAQDVKTTTVMKEKSTVDVKWTPKVKEEKRVVMVSSEDTIIVEKKDCTIAKAQEAKDNQLTIKVQKVKINNLTKSIDENFLMGIPAYIFFWFYIFYIWGIILWWIGLAIKGVKTSPTSPDKFSFKYWWNQPENKVKIYTAFLVLSIGFFVPAFSKYLFSTEITGFTVPYQLIALAAGLCWQAVVEFVLTKLNINNFIKLPETTNNANVNVINPTN